VDVSDLKFSKAGLSAEEPNSPKSTNGALHIVLEETERRQILKALDECNWVVAGPNGAAAQLAIKRSTLQLRMHKLGIARNSA
jgi:formate hydrogenlyase transcriptional activator